jgi:hypothetical protein
MKYATWELHFPTEGSLEGTTPESVVRSQGKFIEGAFFLSNNLILGYVGDDVTATGLSDWKFTLITQGQALDLALAKNESAYLAEDGNIVMPFDDPYSSSFSE